MESELQVPSNLEIQVDFNNDTSEILNLSASVPPESFLTKLEYELLLISLKMTNAYCLLIGIRKPHIINFFTNTFSITLI